MMHMSENPNVTIKGRVFEIPPLDTGQVKRNWKQFTNVLNGMEAAGIAGFADLVEAQSDLLLLALGNQYPELTMEDVETLDIASLNEAVTVVIESVARPKARTPAPTT